MNLQTAKFLVEVGKECDIETSLYEDYSGRGMYGKTTVGIVTENPLKLLGTAVTYAVDVDYDVAEVKLDNLRSDTLGYDTILY